MSQPLHFHFQVHQASYILLSYVKSCWSTSHSRSKYCNTVSHYLQ
jgi:hypothetical protein